MMPFTVQIQDTFYTIELLQDRTFGVSSAAGFLATIYPEAGQLRLVWKSKQEISAKLTRKLGKEIEAYQLGAQSL